MTRVVYGVQNVKTRRGQIRREIVPKFVTDWLRKADIIAGLGSLLVTLASGTAWAQGQTGYVLTTTNQLITIDVNNPGTSLNWVPITITGITAGETLVGIDVRPENGYLYGLGVNHTADTMTVYAISARTGFAGIVGAGGFTGAGNLPDPAVARYGIDFNPTVDRLRVTTSQSGAGPAVPGLNFRVNVSSGALVQADTDINPAPISIDEVAYTNNGRHGAITTLYTISSAQDALYIQTPPNAGTQTAPIALSQDLTAVHGFDMDSQAVTTTSNTPVTAGSSQAFAVVTTAAGTGLVRINLLTGAVSALAPIAGNTTNIRGFAVNDSRVSGSYPATALDSAGPALLRFNTPTPGTTSTSALGGLVAGDVMVGIDIRPNTGQLYGLGFNSVANTVQLYVIDPWTNLTNATSTPLGAPFVLPTAGATAFGFDFNPAVDRIRVVTNANDNFRLNPFTGAVAGVDSPINHSSGMTAVTGAAYTNSFGQPIDGNGRTELQTLDAFHNAVATQNQPNSGTQSFLRSVTIDNVQLDFNTINGFDIAPEENIEAGGGLVTGKAYTVLTVGANTLYSIDLRSGIATQIGGNFPASLAGLALGDAPLAVPTITVTPLSAQTFTDTPATFMVTLSPADAQGEIRFFENGTPVGGRRVENGQGVFGVTLPVAGNHQLTASFVGGFNAGSVTLATPIAIVVSPYRQHFAEGATGSFFQTDIGVLNANSNPTNVTLTLFPEGSPSFTQTFTLPTLSRRTLDINAILAAQGLSGAVSTLLESTRPIAATRQMTYGTPVYGSTLESGVPDTSLSWYFAEGATSVYSLYFLIENPNSAPTDVTFTHLVEGGGAPVTRTVTVDRQSRKTFNVNEVPGLAEAALSTVVTSTLPIVAERAMYITSASTRLFEAGTASAGATAPGTNWSFAEGATGFFYTYLLLGNPQTVPADVTVVYQLPDGTTIPKSYTVQPQSRRTVDVAAQDALLASASFSMTVTSTQPIVAERAMWWYLPFREGSAVIGATATGASWGIGEGAEGGVTDESTFVLVSNGSSSAAMVRFTVVYDDGTDDQKDYSMAATSRLTVRIGADFPMSVGKRFSVLVDSLTPAVPITVEYARYQSASGFLESGGAALATRVR
jgi:hypothetical protein